uniref:Uncharacterized protein n=1 Tax=Arundo donax TaxID=35708 RepID=A0A0A9HPR1_ARUDO
MTNCGAVALHDCHHCLHGQRTECSLPCLVIGTDQKQILEGRQFALYLCTCLIINKS